MGIIDGKPLFCHNISEESVDKKISTGEYNNRNIYDCFDNTFEDYFDSPALHLPPITIDDRHSLHKRSRYKPDLIPAAIFVASENVVSILIDPYYLPQLILLPSYDPNPPHAIKKY